MRKRVLEESVMFISIIKWFFLATIVGIIVGGSTTFFLKALEGAISFSDRYAYSFLILPLALFLSSLVVKYLSPEAEGHGTEKVIEAVHKRSGKINPLVVPIKLIATIITIMFGGSAGKEGPCAQIGAGLSSIFSSLFRFNDKDRMKLVMCGISAGFSTVFGTPIAGAIFGVEVLFVGSLLYDVLFPSFVAGIVGYQVSSLLGITYFHQPLSFVPIFSSLLFTKVCISGIFFGLCAFVFIELMKFIESISKNMTIWKPYKGLVGGAVLVVLSFVFSTKLLGLGLETIQVALEGEYVNPLIFIGKMLFTSITLSFGGSGGIVTPIFFIGATAGNTFANIFGMDVAMFSAIGMVALLAGAANTPISASIMAVELFGPEVAPYAAVACVISFLMTGHRSVYPSQVLAVTKSPSIYVEKGMEMEDILSVQIKPRPKSVTDILLKVIQNIKKIKNLK
ncbi:voltage-gated chloride channel [bacterium]|nr:MAG: voltage-gated chloride channel [bacterium]